MKPIPCIETKCLKYPACRNKKQISCDLLNEHCIFMDNQISDHTLVWIKLQMYFPNLSVVDREKDKFDLVYIRNLRQQIEEL